MRNTTWRWQPTSPPADLADWVEVQELERDIVLLYHQLIVYSNIMGDLDYGSVFGLPYWDYLNPIGLDQDRGVFVQEGCLVMLLAIAWGQLDGSVGYLDQRHQAISKSISRCHPLGKDGLRLLNHVRAVFEFALTTDSSNSDPLLTESAWVHRMFVRGYFLKQLGLDIG
ncbi:hypothetical protein ACSYAD_02850 [Acaryochloris marina NIES-2412]|uniref:hypothetical protein n=1 Tax=Acaryochloris marina TaxID=155978 RepID=UPI0040596A7B